MVYNIGGPVHNQTYVDPFADESNFFTQRSQ